jgi:hypothetical protein
MYDEVVPRLNHVLFFEKNSFKSATKPVYDGKDWYIQGQFFVKDLPTEQYNKTKPFYRRRRGNKNGDLGHAFPFLMCNQSFFIKHKADLEADGYKPIILEKFNTTEATDLLAEKIRAAGDHISIEQLWSHLATFADTEYDL